MDLSENFNSPLDEYSVPRQYWSKSDIAKHPFVHGNKTDLNQVLIDSL